MVQTRIATTRVELTQEQERVIKETAKIGKVSVNKFIMGIILEVSKRISQQQSNFKLAVNGQPQKPTKRSSQKSYDLFILFMVIEEY